MSRPQDVSSDIVFTEETLTLLNRVGGMLIHLRGKCRDSADVVQAVDEAMEQVNDLHSAIAAQMEANEHAER